MLESPNSHTVATPAALEFALLEACLASTGVLQLRLHEVASQQQTKGREVQRLLLQAHIERCGDGDVGPALRVPQQAGTVLYTHRRLRSRSLKTIFGPVEIHRMGYSRDGAPSIYPLDQTLALPARSFSYELQRRLVKAAVQNPFHESVEAIADLTGVSVPKRSLEEILQDAALDFDAFYRERGPEPASGSILVAAVDGKGIPMIKPGGTQPAVRLTKGQKANRKRMATVAAVFTRAPWVRTYAHQNRLWKACSVSNARPPSTGKLPHARRTNGCGPVCSRARPPSLRRWPRRCSAVTRKESRLAWR